LASPHNRHLTKRATLGKSAAAAGPYGGNA
jgi:hypothetical protein